MAGSAESRKCLTYWHTWRMIDFRCFSSFLAELNNKLRTCWFNAPQGAVTNDLCPIHTIESQNNGSAPSMITAHYSRCLLRCLFVVCVCSMESPLWYIQIELCKYIEWQQTTTRACHCHCYLLNLSPVTTPLTIPYPFQFPSPSHYHSMTMTGGSASGRSASQPVTQSLNQPSGQVEIERATRYANASWKWEMENVTCTKHIVDIAPFAENRSDQTHG